MPLPVAVIVGSAVLHGLRIVGLRIIPYIIRSKTAKAAAQYATKKVGEKSITHAGYVVVTKDPTKFRLAQKIFGKKRVFRSDKILQVQSTAEKELVPLTKKIWNSKEVAKAPEIKNLILSEADDAANGISKFIAHPRSNPVIGGTKEVTKEFKKFFGKDWEPISKNTIEAIKITERGPLSLSKDVAKIIPKPGVTVGAPKTIKGTPKFLKEFSKTSKSKELSVVKPITVTKDRPWYVNIMPKVLRTRKEALDTSTAIYPHGVRTITEGIAKGRLASTVGGGYGLYEGGKYIASNMGDTDEITRGGIDLNDSDLFETASQEYGQEEIASGINIYDTDEQGNVIQAQ